MSAFSLFLLIATVMAATGLCCAAGFQLFFAIKGRGRAHQGLTAASALMLNLTMLLVGMMERPWWGIALGLLGLLAVAGVLILQDQAH